MGQLPQQPPPGNQLNAFNYPNTSNNQQIGNPQKIQQQQQNNYGQSIGNQAMQQQMPQEKICCYDQQSGCYEQEKLMGNPFDNQRNDESQQYYGSNMESQKGYIQNQHQVQQPQQQQQQYQVQPQQNQNQQIQRQQLNAVSFRNGATVYAVPQSIPDPMAESHKLQYQMDQSNEKQMLSGGGGGTKILHTSHIHGAVVEDNNGNNKNYDQTMDQYMNQGNTGSVGGVDPLQSVCSSLGLGGIGYSFGGGLSFRGIALGGEAYLKSRFADGGRMLYYIYIYYIKKKTHKKKIKITVNSIN